MNPTMYTLPDEAWSDWDNTQPSLPYIKDEPPPIVGDDLDDYEDEEDDDEWEQIWEDDGGTCD